jgi:hypothetical protein
MNSVIEKGIIHGAMQPHRIEASALYLFGTPNCPVTEERSSSHCNCTWKLSSNFAPESNMNIGGKDSPSAFVAYYYISVTS